MMRALVFKRRIETRIHGFRRSDSRTSAALTLAAVAVAAALVCACGGARKNDGKGDEYIGFNVPGEPATTYKTKETEPAIPEGQCGVAVRKEIGRSAKLAGRELVGDGRLDQLAEWLIDNLDAKGNPPTEKAIEYYVRHLGLPEPTPHLLILGVPDSLPLEQKIFHNSAVMLAKQEYTHFGSTCKQASGMKQVAIVYSSRWARIFPVQRSIEPGHDIWVRGTLTHGYKDAIAVVSRPDGETWREEAGKGADFDIKIPADTAGIHRVELVAEGEYGPTVIALFPVFAGMSEREDVESVDEGAGYDFAPPEDEATFVKRLMELVNYSRSEAGLGALAPHDKLSAVARGHSEDMRDHSYVGHKSPITGDASDRVRRAGLPVDAIAENVGRGYSADEIHSELMNSPAHRANILNPDVTHMGIGLALQQDEGKPAFLVTELFVKLIDKIDVNTASAEIVGKMNKFRARKDALPLQIDAELSKYAQEAAESYFLNPGLSSSDLLMRLKRRIGDVASRYARVTTMMTVVGSLDQAAKVKESIERDLGLIGIGVAQGIREDTAPGAIAVVMILVCPR